MCACAYLGVSGRVWTCMGMSRHTCAFLVCVFVSEHVWPCLLSVCTVFCMSVLGYACLSVSLRACTCLCLSGLVCARLWCLGKSRRVWAYLGVFICTWACLWTSLHVCSCLSVSLTSWSQLYCEFDVITMQCKAFNSLTITDSHYPFHWSTITVSCPSCRR